MSLRRSVIAEHLTNLKQTLAVLDAHKDWEQPALEKDTVTLFAVERALQIAIQCLLDVGNHIISASPDWDRPHDYAGIVDALALHHVLPAEFAERIRSMAGFRNVLVRAYLKVDVGRVVLALHSLDDFRCFASYISSYIGE
jgi:uncharacterized protein YutE (UPF0331/DUF86 family)